MHVKEEHAILYLILTRYAYELVPAFWQGLGLSCHFEFLRLAFLCERLFHRPNVLSLPYAPSLMGDFLCFAVAGIAIPSILAVFKAVALQIFHSPVVIVDDIKVSRACCRSEYNVHSLFTIRFLSLSILL